MDQQHIVHDLTPQDVSQGIAEGRYRSGLGLFLDIINAQAVLLNTTISQATALSQVKQSTAALYRAIGGSVPGLK